MANYLWAQGSTVGNNDSTVSPYLKTWISQNGVVVCGVTGEGTSKEIQANWDSPFEGESVGSKFQVAGGLAQTWTNKTTITAYQSRQVWGGNRPTQFNLVMRFYALSDPKTEVMDALMSLEQMISPQVNANDPGNAFGQGGFGLGRIPDTVIINVGRNAIYPDCVIESISQPLDTEKDDSGRFIRAEVSVQVQTMQMLNRSEISARYG